jgi:hypothetical protein
LSPALLALRIIVVMVFTPIIAAFGVAGEVAAGLFWWLLTSWKPRLRDYNA